MTRGSVAVLPCAYRDRVVISTINVKKIFPIILFVLAVLVPSQTFAHQPLIVTSREIIVVDPEISKAYYGQLTGVADVYTIESGAPFTLYVNILVPDIAGQKKDVSATISKDGQSLAELLGEQFQWKQMFEPFGYDSYWTGPEYKAPVSAGTYVITIRSRNNDSKYSLAVGEVEVFDYNEIKNSLTVIPELKRSFFNESPISFICSPFGWGLILILYLLAGIVGLLYRYVLKRMSKNRVRRSSKNIGTPDRVIRFAIGIALLLWAITTTWSVLLIFLSGFTLFEAFFSWCGLYAALGKNTCPTE